MNLDCLKCSKFMYNNNVKIKHEITGRIKLCSYYIDCGFKKFEAIDKEDLNDLLKRLNYMQNNAVLFFEVQNKYRK